MKCNRMDQQKSNLSFENMDEIEYSDRSMRRECCEERRKKLTRRSVCTGQGSSLSKYKCLQCLVEDVSLIPKPH